MATAFVQSPKSITYTFTPTLDTQIPGEEIEAMGQLAGRLCRNYRITPKQAILITALAVAALSILIGCLVTPVAFLGLGLSAFGFYYRFHGQDIHSQTVRRQMSEAFAKMSSLDIVENPKELDRLIDYDLSSFIEKEDRLRHYVLLKRLQALFIQITKQRLSFERQLETTKQTSEEGLTINSHYLEKRAPFVESLSRAQAAIEKTKKLLEEQNRVIDNLKKQIAQIKQEHHNSDQPLSTKAQEAADLRLLQLPSLERKLTKLTPALRERVYNLKQEEQLVEYHQKQLDLFDQEHRNQLEKLESWQRGETHALELALQTKLSSLEKQLSEALPNLSAPAT